LKVGDLVKLKAGPGWVGHGVVVEIISASHVRIRWFDEWSSEEPFGVTSISTLITISEAT
jgi:uncharacterized protein YodC (DUF2158 family)